MRARAPSWRRSRARNGRPLRPRMRASSEVASAAHATSSGPQSPAATRTDVRLPATKALNQAAGGGEPTEARGTGPSSPTTTAQSASKSRRAWWASVSRSSSTLGFSTRTAAVSKASRRGSATCSVARRTSSTSTPSTWAISLISRGTSSSPGSSTTSSSIARPAPRSRMSTPTRSPRTAPIRLATAPSAPGRSGTHTLTTYVVIPLPP